MLLPRLRGRTWHFAATMVFMACLRPSSQAAALRMVSTTAATTAGGSSFYQRIGRPKYVVAPMVDQSEKAFRLLCRRHGCDLAFTQMLHAKQFGVDNAGKFRKQHFDGDQIVEGEDPHLDRPLIAQFCGNDPDVLVKAASYVQHQVDACDLNFGCPQQIAKKGNYGAYLLPKADLCERLVGAMASQLECPVTVKIRCLEDPAATIVLAKRLEAAGAQLITVHGRTVRAAKTDTGPADWAIIAEIKARLSIPVVANGGIETRADAERCLAATGADAVMSSEALLEDPALFDHALPPLCSLTGAALAHRQLSLAGEYLALAAAYPPEVGAGPVRAHLFKMLHRLLAVHMDLRGKLANGHAARGVEGIGGVVRELGQRYGWDLDAGHAVLAPEALVDARVHTVSWYRRHRAQEQVPQ